MAQTQGNEKLELFHREILKKAQAERDEILRETEDFKKAELDKEENRLLSEFYQEMQAEISRVQIEHVKQISRETQALKKQLYQQREDYLSQLLAQAREALVAFTHTAEYGAFLRRRAQELAQEHRFPGSVFRLRSVDLPYLGMLQEIYGDCKVKADDEAITIGGMILSNPARGVEVDASLDTLLEEQRDWFHSSSNFSFE